MHRMTDVCRSAPAERGQPDARRLATLAEKQYGVVSRAQLLSAGVSDSAISRWVVSGRLHRIHPRIYALGHAALSLEGRLRAALMYAGSRAALSHTTAAWAWRLIEAEPIGIHLTVPGRRRSLPGVRIHHSRHVDIDDQDRQNNPVRCRGLPVTSVARTLVDLAGVLSYPQVRRALAEADFHGLLDLRGLELELRGRRRGSSLLRAAVRSHLPQLAHTVSALEERFLELCESAALPMPEVNAKVGRMTVDALWPKRQLAVELDGAAAHGAWAAIQRDRQRELALRAAGFQVVRYTWDQVTGQPDGVIADLRRLLGPADQRPAARPR
jgi:Transcriptional regulator, AbiEi antitoxin/Protein of unknown function (DUF559)